MLAWGPASVNIAFRRPNAKERSSIGLSERPLCIVAVDASQGTWTCVLATSGAYWCPPLHEPTGPPLKALGGRNATIDKRGRLKRHTSLNGTHPPRPLAWQRYPHVEGYVEPWTSRGTLRSGLRFDGEGRGPCYAAEEAPPRGIRCQNRRRGSDACFPQRSAWRAGDLAACALEPGATRFLRWRITGP